MQNFKCTTERFISVQHDQQLLAAFPMRIPSIPQALADSGWNSTGMNGLRENRHRLLCKPTCSLTHKPFNAPQHCRHIGSVDRYLPRSPCVLPTMNKESTPGEVLGRCCHLKHSGLSTPEPLPGTWAGLLCFPKTEMTSCQTQSLWSTSYKKWPSISILSCLDGFNIQPAQL